LLHTYLRPIFGSYVFNQASREATFMKEKYTTNKKLYFSRLYSSNRRLKKCALRQERHLAKVLALVLGLSDNKGIKKPYLPGAFEFFLTWKLKTGCCPNRMWCSDLEQLKLKRLGERNIAFKSDIWIGLEAGDNRTSKGYITGEIEIKSTYKELKRYNMVISHEGSTYVVKKT
ncbi:hypothetical protein, partial [Alteromonas sp. KUL150]|uniref:hypothetical protein n=1 Tax=Alteromonas sp. KUL150 TaxID=2480805 RepID=UPI001F3E5287